jgi:hypothetical protein
VHPAKKNPPEKPARPNPPQKPPKPTATPSAEPVIPISVIDTNAGHHPTHSNSSLPNSPRDSLEQHSPRGRPARPMKEPPKIGIEHAHSGDRNSVSVSEDDRSASSEYSSVCYIPFFFFFLFVCLELFFMH